MDDGYGQYVNKDLSQLKSEYTPVQLYVNASTKTCPLGAGSRILFWVAGDGSKTLFYLTAGWPVVVSNKDFSITKVVGSEATMEIGGRIKYKLPGDEAWRDLGPIYARAFDPEVDPPLDHTRKLLLVSNSDHDIIAELELDNAKKSGELDDLFSMGDCFD